MSKTIFTPQGIQDLNFQKAQLEKEVQGKYPTKRRRDIQANLNKTNLFLNLSDEGREIYIQLNNRFEETNDTLLETYYDVLLQKIEKAQGIVDTTEIEKKLPELKKRVYEAQGVVDKKENKELQIAAIGEIWHMPEEEKKVYEEELSAKISKDVINNFTLESLEQKIGIGDEYFVKDCLLKSVAFQNDYFAEKWNGIVNLLANKSLNANEIIEIIENYNVDSMAKGSLIMFKFIGFLSGDIVLQKIETNL